MDAAESKMLYVQTLLVLQHDSVFHNSRILTMIFASRKGSHTNNLLSDMKECRSGIGSAASLL